MDEWRKESEDEDEVIELHNHGAYPSRNGCYRNSFIHNHEARDTEIVIRFTHTEGGLQAKDSALKGFVVAGVDRHLVR